MRTCLLVLLRFRSFACYEPLRCAYRESYGHARPGSAGSLPSPHMYPHVHVYYISRTLICVCIYIGFLERTRCAAASAVGPVPYVHAGAHILIFALAFVYAYNGSSRGPGSLTRVTTLPTGVTVTHKAFPHGSHDAGRTRGAAASAVGPGIHIHTGAHIFIYSHWHLCVHI